MNIEGVDREVLEQYMEMRRAITKRVDRIVAVSHLLNLLKHCGDDSVEACPMALATVGDLLDAEATSIQELLDGFIYVGDAEETLEG